MQKRWIRSIAILAVFAALATLLGPPASANTLTSTSWSASNTQLGNAGSQYAWNFTPATSATVAQVSATVPPGTTTANTRYAAFNGSTGNYFSTPDSSALHITGDIDLRARIQLDSWSVNTKAVIGKWASGSSSYMLQVGNGGKLYLSWFATVGGSQSVPSSINTGLAPNAVKWIRATMNSTTGDVNFYLSDDGITWTQLGTTVSHAASTIQPLTSPLLFGAQDTTGASPMQGRIYYGEVRNGINGTVVASFDPTRDAVAGTSWTASTGEVYTAVRAGTPFPADIASDLTVSANTGIATGTAMLREIDHAAAYRVTTPVTLGLTASSFTLTGFTNTTTAGGYRSVVTTYDATPTTVDTATAAIVWFANAPGANLTPNTLALSSTAASATAVTYTFTESNVTLSAIKCMSILFSQNADGSGGKPTGMSIASAALSGTSNYIPTPASWAATNDDSYGLVNLTYATGQTPASASSRTIVLTGITNPSTTGTSYARVVTYANVDCATGAVDTAALAFVLAPPVNFNLMVDPVLLVTVAGYNSGSCNGTALTSTTSTGTAIPLGRINLGVATVAGQTITVQTNAGTGFTTYVYRTGQLASGANTIADWTGTNASPTTFPAPGTAAFGYTTDDTGNSRFQPNKWAGLNTTPSAVQTATGATASSAANVCFQATTSSATIAANYTTTVIYSVVPSF